MKKEAKDLLKKYKEGRATQAEKDLLGDWVFFGKHKEYDLTAEQLHDDLSLIGKGLPLHPIKRLWPRIAVAASVTLFLALSAYFLAYKKPIVNLVKQPVAVHATQAIVPGSNKAYLTLANGQKIALTGVANGKIAKQAGITITKTRNGQLVYHIDKSPAGSNSNAAITFNTIETPRGGQYQVILPDGTQVWLNAASSLKYPTTFSGNSRQVQLSGEAYFEVAHDAARPFKVLSKGQQIEVLGTHFNVNAYDDDPAIQTTLLEGSVKISNNTGQVMLKPGQQATLKDDYLQFSVKNVDANDAIAWKNGYFMFKNENIKSVMKKIARWYDVDIDYEGDLYQKRLGGTVSKFEKINDLLHTIQLTHSVHFKVIGRRVIVMP